MNIYKLKIQYKGTRYVGWQIQKNDTGISIQGQLHLSLKKITKSDEVRTIGCGRTDAGVHAFSQFVRVEIPLKIEANSLLKALNSHLPDDIRVVSSEHSSESFNPVFDSKEKEYHYVFSTQKIVSPFLNDLVTYVSFDLNIEAMKKACNCFVGVHDFANFRTVGTDVKSTVREVFSCEIVAAKNTDWFQHFGEDIFVLKITGTGFLKQMVRLIMGTLFNVGRSKVSEEQIREALKNPVVEKLAAVAAPNGLYLVNVKY